MKLSWMGHSGFLLFCGDTKILIDPFVSGNGSFPVNLQSEINNPDYILITHGHPDHVGDSIRLYNPQKTKVVSNVEICTWLMSKSVNNCIPLNIGGGFTDNDIHITLVEAIHSSSIVSGDQVLYGGLAAGLIIKYKESVIYHLGDTEIFDNMKLIEKRFKPQIGLVPIGDKMTMSPSTAASVCNDYFNFKTIIPIHYGTFPMINGSPDDFIKMVRNKDAVKVLKPGDFLEI
jgi:L-ascorbate metabolism protein UlaG (beta-lactamase superfamily)